MRIREQACSSNICLSKFKFNCDEIDPSIPDPLPKNLSQTHNPTRGEGTKTQRSGEKETAGQGTVTRCGKEAPTSSARRPESYYATEGNSQEKEETTDAESDDVRLVCGQKSKI